MNSFIRKLLLPIALFALTLTPSISAMDTPEHDVENPASQVGQASSSASSLSYDSDECRRSFSQMATATEDYRSARGNLRITSSVSIGAFCVGAALLLTMRLVAPSTNAYAAQTAVELVFCCGLSCSVFGLLIGMCRCCMVKPLRVAYKEYFKAKKQLKKKYKVVSRSLAHGYIPILNKQQMEDLTPSTVRDHIMAYYEDEPSHPPLLILPPSHPLKTRERLLALRYPGFWKRKEWEQSQERLNQQKGGNVNGVILPFLFQEDLSSVLLTSSYGIRPITEPHLRKNMEKGVEKRKQKRKEFVNEKTPLLIAPMV